MRQSTGRLIPLCALALFASGDALAAQKRAVAPASPPAAIYAAIDAAADKILPKVVASILVARGPWNGSGNARVRPPSRRLGSLIPWIHNLPARTATSSASCAAAPA